MSRCLVVTAALVVACSTEQSNVSDSGSEAPAAALTDAQIAGVLHALDEGDVQEGRLAVASSVGDAVVAFASQVVTAESSADATLTHSVTPADSALGDGIRAKTSRDLASLAAQSGAAFDLAYVTTQVANHRAALALIDMVLTQSASSDAVRVQIQSARDRATDHLANADALQRSRRP